ncbi:MAG: squalene synthase HpnC [Phycisphaerales bacterium]|nr:squalene synthase HpnC [Phycisphaerales bacterium]
MNSNTHLNPASQLALYGPDQVQPVTLDEAQAYCRRLTTGHYENFTVLSRLVPIERRPDFAAIYSFCRWSDDLGDEIGDKDRSTELLQWWRSELHKCFAGESRHPVFVALQPAIERRGLQVKPFDDLISAFEQDQHKTRYESWDDVLAYCQLSANPVGRLVLAVCEDEPVSKQQLSQSDDICTALQLTNHWQDVQRDWLERDRLYIPNALISSTDFEARLDASCRQGYAPDQTFLGEFQKTIRLCVDKTWMLYERGCPLIDQVSPTTRPLIWLFAAGGRTILRRIEQWNCMTCLMRPRLTKFTKAQLLLNAWCLAWRLRRSKAN